jgi:hypothetical protein
MMHRCFIRNDAVEFASGHTWDCYVGDLELIVAALQRERVAAGLVETARRIQAPGGRETR